MDVMDSLNVMVRALFAAIISIPLLVGCGSEGGSDERPAARADGAVQADGAPGADGDLAGAGPDAAGHGLDALDAASGQAERYVDGGGAYTGGEAVFAELEHDFGLAYPEQPLKHVFKVRNQGREPLRITKVEGS